MNPYAINPMAAARNATSSSAPKEEKDPQDPAKNKPETDPELKALDKELALMDEVSYSEQDVLQSYLPFANNPDPIVRSKGLKIYREMMQDEQVKVCVEVRIQARLSTPWEVVPGTPGNAQSEEMAAFVKENLEGMRGNFETDMEQMYSAMTYGFSVTEKIFTYLDRGKFKGKIGLKALKTREPYNYDFKVDAHGNLLGLTYIGIVGKDEQPTVTRPGDPFNISGMTPGFIEPSRVQSNGRAPLGSLENPFPPEKFIIYSYNPQFGNWYGRSELMAAFKWWLMKKHGAKFWAIWLERYASPFMIAQYKRDAGLNAKALQAVDDFLRNLSARQSIRVSDAWTFTPVQFNASASNSAYEGAIEAYNRYIAHAILFPNLLGFTGAQGSGGGSYSLGQKQFDSFLWILNKMGRDMEETVVREQIIKQLIHINYGDDVPSEMMPKFRFISIDDATIEIRTKIIDTLARAGVINKEEEWVRDFLTIPKKAPGVVLPETEQPGGPGQPGADPKAGDDPKKGGEGNPAEKKPTEKKTDKSSGEEESQKMSQFKEREPDVFERKMKVKQFREDLERLDTGLFDDASEALIDIRNELIDRVERKKIVIDEDAAAVSKLTINVKDLKDVFAKWMVKTYLDSKLGQLEEMGRAGLKVEVVKKFAAVSNDWEPLPPQEAVDYFRRKVSAKIIDENGKKVVIDIATGFDLQFFQNRAFTIAGIVRDDLLNDAKQLLLNGIKRQDHAGTVKNLKDLFNKYLDQGVEVDEELLSPHRLNTIVRTNITEAVNEGRAAMMTDPDVQEFVQFFQYTAIIDERTTDYCSCMDGKTFRIEDLPMLKPPAHYNCRSFTVPITQFEIQDLKREGRGVEVSTPCPDRMAGFADLKTDPIEVREKAAPQELPKVVKPAEEVKTDLPPAQRTAADDAATEKLKHDLGQLIARCPYQFCGSDKIRFTGRKMNVGEYVCDTCQVPFKLSTAGDMYLYDAGTDIWERKSLGHLPKFFSQKGK